jgi:copper homeostasis protein
MAILVEVCISSVADARAAAAAGADRLELCGCLELGGVTPSVGAVEAVLEATSLPVVVMTRPRAGGFAYDRDEFAVMLRDAERFIQLGAAGIVFGMLDRNGRVDRARSEELIACAGARETVFHRAFDFVRDWRTELETLVDLGCTRILTSGGAPTALAGAALIRQMVETAAGRIEILPGGGIGGDNVAEIIRVTGCQQVHIGAAAVSDDGSLAESRGINFFDARFANGTSHRAVNADAVAATVAAARDPACGA